jgi:hypothetical protein
VQARATFAIFYNFYLQTFFQLFCLQATTSETTPAIPRRNYSGQATTVKISGIVADNDDNDDDNPMAHEVKEFRTYPTTPRAFGGHDKFVWCL